MDKSCYPSERKALFMQFVYQRLIKRLFLLVQACLAMYRNFTTKDNKSAEWDTVKMLMHRQTELTNKHWCRLLGRWHRPVNGLSFTSLRSRSNKCCAHFDETMSQAAFPEMSLHNRPLTYTNIKILFEAFLFFKPFFAKEMMKLYDLNLEGGSNSSAFTSFN